MTPECVLGGEKLHFQLGDLHPAFILAKMWLRCPILGAPQTTSLQQLAMQAAFTFI